MTRALVLLSVLATMVARAAAAQPAGPETFLTRAIFADGELWALSDVGRLFRIAPGTARPSEERLPEPARDLCLLGGHPAIVTCDGKGCGTWTLRRRSATKWSSEATLQKDHDAFVALSCDTSVPLMLTTRRLVELDGAVPRTVVLSEPLQVRGVVSLFATADTAFVGLNHGEFGGGMRQIDRRSGTVRIIESNITGELCGGPLNTECDPVTGIAGEPGHPDCVVAAIGLVHFQPRGRLVEVCGSRVRRLYVKPYGDRARARELRPKSDEPMESVAFFGVVLDGDSMWAAGIDGIYQIRDGTTRLAHSLPQFEKAGPFQVSFTLPRLVLVLTNVNQRASMSGAAPLLVVR